MRNRALKYIISHDHRMSFVNMNNIVVIISILIHAVNISWGVLCPRWHEGFIYSHSYIALIWPHGQSLTLFAFSPHCSALARHFLKFISLARLFLKFITLARHFLKFISLSRHAASLDRKKNEKLLSCSSLACSGGRWSVVGADGRGQLGIRKIIFIKVSILAELCQPAGRED